MAVLGKLKSGSHRTCKILNQSRTHSAVITADCAEEHELQEGPRGGFVGVQGVAWSPGGTEWCWSAELPFLISRLWLRFTEPEQPFQARLPDSQLA